MMSESIQQQTLSIYKGALIGLGKDTKDLDDAIINYEEMVVSLLEGIDKTISNLRGRFPDLIQNKQHLQQLISTLQESLIDKNCSHIVDAEIEQSKSKIDITPRNKKSCRDFFRKIANLTHSDKLRARGVSEEEIERLRNVFEEACKLKEVGDAYGLEFIYTSLVAKNANINRESIVKAKKSRINSLRRQRFNIENSIEGRIHRVFVNDEHKAEVMYLAQSKAELEMLKTQLMRLTVLNNSTIKGK